MPIFSLTADVTDGFVDEDGDLLLLLLLSSAVNLNARIGGHRLAHHRGLAIDAHPALLNPGISLPPRAQAQLGHALVQANGQRRTVWVGGFGDADGSRF